MPLTCSLCGLPKWRSDFSRSSRDKADRVCKACRDTRDRDVKEARRTAAAAGQKICSACKQAKPLDAYNAGENYRRSRCKACKALANREARRDCATPRPYDPARGSPETGFTCSLCKTFKDAENYRIVKAGHWDYRCKECLAKKTREYRETREGIFVTARSIALRRGLEWNLTLEEYTSLRSLPCHYCGFRLPASGIGLDRKENGPTYSAETVVPCCMECNLAKGSIFTYEEMLVIGKAVRKVKKARRASGRDQLPNGWGRPRKYS